MTAASEHPPGDIPHTPGYDAEPRITARRKKTRDRLLGAAVTVFARHGITGTSIEQLCEEAGMTRGAFYSNFTSIDELVLALVQRAIGSVLTDLTAAMAETKSKAQLDMQCFAELSPEDKLSTLLEVGRQSLFSADLTRWTDSIAWIIVEAEIDLYTMRVPKLRSAYLELRGTHTRMLAAEIEQLLDRFGMHTTIPIEELTEYLAAVHLHASRQSIPATAAAEAPVPDRGDLLVRDEPYSTQEIPQNSLMQPAHTTKDEALTLLVKFLEMA